MINYSLTMRRNPSDAADAKKAYATAQAKAVLDINDFAEHIVTHGCVYSKGDIVGILTMAVSCIRENLLLGNIIKLGDLGKFYITLKSKGAKTFDEFTVSNIKKVNAKWSAGSDLKNLINDATFNLVTTKAEAAAARVSAYGTSTSTSTSTSSTDSSTSTSSTDSSTDTGGSTSADTTASN